MNRWIRSFRGVETDRPVVAGPDIRGGEPAIAPREAGDRARARRAWREAAIFYGQHLDARPEDGAIWMQLGHASKEAGDLDGAEAAYRTAQSLLQGDADVPLQIGHLMKLRGRNQDAVAAYGAALAILPTSEAYGELVRMSRGVSAARPMQANGVSQTPTLFLQITDLLNFLRVHRTPSGIQRVQLGILECSLEDGGAGETLRVEFVVTRPNDPRIWQASRPALISIIEQLRAVEVDHPQLRAAVDGVIATATLVKPGRRDSFVELGAFWGKPDNATRLNALRKQGTSVGVYLYDVIPLTHPEYCDRQLVVDFTTDFCETLPLIDFALAISQFTAAQVKSFARANGLPEPPIAVVPLAHSLTGQVEPDPIDIDEDLDWTDEIAHLRGREFVLCVCTIEPRKNHRYLYDVWKALKTDGMTVPDLVFVGRRGWNVDDLFTQMRNSDWLGGSISVVHDLSDRQLATLYRACLFTAFPSIVEGWGLPVGESLSHGRLCVSSSASSMPEVGGDFVVYVDPLNLRDGIATFRELILDRGRIDAWERRIRSDFLPRHWNDVSSDIFGSIGRLRCEPRRPRGELVAELRPGSFLHFGRFARGGAVRGPADYAALERMALGDSFYPPEKMGAWMKGRTGALRFRTGLPEGRSVVCCLVLKGAPNVQSGEVSVSGSVDGVSALPLSANRLRTLRLKGKVGPSGEMTVRLAFAGTCPPHHPDEREFCMAIVAFGFADAADAVGRAELLEALLVDHAELQAS